MTLLDAPRSTPDESPVRPRTGPRPLRAPAAPEEEAPDRAAGAADVERAPIQPSRPVAPRGMQIRRVRLGSVAKLAAVFWVLLGLVLVATVVVVWNVVQSFGFVESFEETVTTSLGLERFEIDGGGIFRLVAGGIAALCAFGWLCTIALAAVFNAASDALGGLAVETGPLQQRGRVSSWVRRWSTALTE
ncbi:MAG TPA: DUF3566 domain-containing protein [Acidimicrobiales bacterium]|nr:DUF3566 domain-containing protein [Acidimicrobiales bacterium]